MTAATESWSEAEEHRTQPGGLAIVPGQPAARRPAQEPWRHRPAVPEELAFPRSAWGHRGYEEGPVDDCVARLRADLAASERHLADLRGEIDRLHRYIRRQWAAIAENEPDGGPLLADPAGDGPSAAHARAVLTQAGELARRRETEARRHLQEADGAARRRLAEAAREAERRLALADRDAQQRVDRAEELAARRLADADAMAERVLAEARRTAAALHG